MAGWVGAWQRTAQLLLDALARYVLSAQKLHADDTPVPVLAPGTGKTKLGRLWAYVRDDRPSGSTHPPAVLLRYTPDRKGKHPREHLKDFSGILQADGYAGFNGLYDRPGNPLLEKPACWAHARRKHFEVFEATKSPIAEGRRCAGSVRSTASRSRSRGRLPEERRRTRSARASRFCRTCIAGYWPACASCRASRSSPAPFTKPLARWEGSAVSATTGASRSTTTAPKSARTSHGSPGRKNYLFAGADCGGVEPPRSIA